MRPVCVVKSLDISYMGAQATDYGEELWLQGVGHNTQSENTRVAGPGAFIETLTSNEQTSTVRRYGGLVGCTLVVICRL